MTVDPDRETALLDRIDDLVEHSRSQPGTVRYCALRDLRDPSVIRFVKGYGDEDAAERHTESDVYRQFVETLPGVVEGDIETVQYEVEDVTVSEFAPGEAVAALD